MFLHINEIIVKRPEKPVRVIDRICGIHQ